MRLLCLAHSLGFLCLTCSPTLHVVSTLALSLNTLTGPIDVLSGTTALVALDADGNQLNGTIPATLSSLTALT